MCDRGGSGHVLELTNQLHKVGGNDRGLARVAVWDSEERRAGRVQLRARSVPEHDVDGLEGFGNFARAERSPAGDIVAQRLDGNLERVADGEGEGVVGTTRDLDSADL